MASLPDALPDLEKQLDVELKILNGAENLLKTVTNKKDKVNLKKRKKERRKRKAQR